MMLVLPHPLSVPSEAAKIEVSAYNMHALFAPDFHGEKVSIIRQ